MALPTLSMCQEGMKLTIDSKFTFPNGSMVEFIDPDPVPLPNAREVANLEDGLLKEGIPTKQKLFRVYVDIGSISSDRIHGFYRYKFYVKAQNQPGGQAGSLFDVRVHPVGDFDDCRRTVRFSVTRGNDRDTGEIDLPIHGFSSKDFISASASNTLQKVELRGDTPIAIEVEDTLEDYSLILTGIPEVASDHAKYWKSPPSAHLLPLNSSEVEIPRKTKTRAVELTVSPKPFTVLGASLTSINPLASQDTIHLGMKYHVEQGGVDRSIDLPIKIRFVPSIWWLLLMVCLGSALGSLVALLDPKGAPGMRNWLKALTAGLILALIVELLGVILVSGGSKFVLLGFDLDPFQIFPVITAGFIVGLTGYRSADLFKKIRTSF